MKVKIFIAGAVLLLAGAGCQLPDRTAQTSQQPASTATATTPQAVVSQSNIITDITWLTPTQGEDLHLFVEDPANTGFDYTNDYVYVGRVNSGKYAGAKLYDVFDEQNEDPSTTDDPPARVLKTATGLVLLDQSSPLPLAVFDPTQVNHSLFTTDNISVIDGLQYADTLTDTKTGHFFIQHGGMRGIPDLVTNGHLTNAFTASNGLLVGQDKNQVNGHYYVSYPDGYYRTYLLGAVPFVDYGEDGSPGSPNPPDYAVPHVTWKDGAKNADQYTLEDLDNNQVGDAQYLTADFKKALMQTASANDGSLIYELDPASYYAKTLYKTYVDNLQYSDTPSPKPLSAENFFAQHPVFYWYDPYGTLMRFHKKSLFPMVMGGMGKPVIYLYPPRAEQVQVSILQKNGLTLTKSTPHYGADGWSVLAHPSGLLTNSDGATYPYLFWEGLAPAYVAPQGGWSVAQKDVHGFLLEKLAALGLNAHEAAQFMAFWEPRMQGSPYYVVRFYDAREMNQLAPLSISPRPDTVIRVFMDFKPVAAPVAVLPQVFPRAGARTGFTVVEWGGALAGSEVK